MNVATTVLKQTTTTSARMPTNIHRTELSTLGSINFDKFSDTLCTKQLHSVTQQYQTNNNKQTANSNINKRSNNCANGGILMESKSLVNVIRTHSNNNRHHNYTLNDERLLEILSAPPDEPLYTNSKPKNQHSNGDKVFGGNLLMQYETATSSIVDGVVTADDYENQPPHDKCIAANHEDGNGEVSSTPQALFSPATWNIIQKDLNSPSALCRVRALRAIKSPLDSHYYRRENPLNDVADEPKIEYPKTIQEVMKGVAVYVEVRSDTENRTAGVKGAIAKLGAKVMERLTKNTTHVVFRNGLPTTYTKARRMNIPVVSILWIEACKRHLTLMDPRDYPISNLEMYENPDIYAKELIPKRPKYKQPENLMKNLHRKIPKSKLLQGLKKMDERNNSALSSSAISSNVSSTTSKLVPPKRLSTVSKVNTSRRSLSQKSEIKPTNTIGSMFEKQIEKSRIENSQVSETVVEESTVSESTTVIEDDKKEDTKTEKLNDEAEPSETVTNETMLVTGNLHNRLTRRNSISVQTPTKATPQKASIDMETSSIMGSARKRRTLFTPSINATIEEEQFSTDFPTFTASD